MTPQNDPLEFTPAISELFDTFARARAQLHVLRLAISGLRDESDVRALLSQLCTVEDELHHSELLLKKTPNG